MVLFNKVKRWNKVQLHETENWGNIFILYYVKISNLKVFKC
jgi:hypothetical protein